MSTLLDTNVVSELMRESPRHHCGGWPHEACDAQRSRFRGHGDRDRESVGRGMRAGLGGLARPSRWKVWIVGREISEHPDRELANVRLSRIGFTFQSYNLLPVPTAEEDAEFTMPATEETMTQENTGPKPGGAATGGSEKSRSVTDRGTSGHAGQRPVSKKSEEIIRESRFGDARP